MYIHLFAITNSLNIILSKWTRFSSVRLKAFLGSLAKSLICWFVLANLCKRSEKYGATYSLYISSTLLSLNCLKVFPHNFNFSVRSTMILPNLEVASNPWHSSMGFFKLFSFFFSEFNILFSCALLYNFFMTITLLTYYPPQEVMLLLSTWSVGSSNL